MLLKILLINFVLYATGENVNKNEYREIKTTQGVVRGFKDNENSIYAFYGIPYAKAPEGPHRYKAPLPAPVWLNTFEAVDKDIICPQKTDKSLGFDMMANKTVKFDCLIANIFVSDTKETNLPVIVYVHGGAFVMGSGNLVTPKKLAANNNVIVVTFNYRLGALGFLCLGTDDAPGNAGMKDQVALLRWVQDNIAKFGGNSKDVTIAGYSAGSMSVDLLMLSKMAEGLFTKVIPESGSNLGAYAILNDPIKKAKEFAKRKGLDNADDFNALHDFYMNTPYEELLEPVVLPIDATGIFSPCVERKTTEKAFLTEAPYSILKAGNYKKLPLLYGLANAEGILIIPNFETYSKQMNKDFTSALPGDLYFESDSQKAEVAAMVKKFYFGDKDVTPETVAAYIDYFTDTYFAISLARAVKLHVAAGHKEIYVYEYAFVDDEVLFPKPSLLKDYVGANHCAQTMAIFDGEFIIEESKLSAKNIEMKNVMRELWYNFAKTSKPVPEGSTFPDWPAAGADCSPHMSLNTTLELRGPLLGERMKFWDQIYEKHYNIPSPPPAPPAKHTEL